MTGFTSKRAAAQDKLAQPAQEPVAWMGYKSGLKTFTAQQRIADAYPEIYTVPLYPSLPQRPWVGLTDEKMQAVVDAQLLVSNINVYFKAIEAKLKKKNT
jgi:hypothetical protein